MHIYGHFRRHNGIKREKVIVFYLLVLDNPHKGDIQDEETSDTNKND